MGLSLTLLPLRGPEELCGTRVFCHDQLNFYRDNRIFDQLIYGRIDTQLIPPQLWIEISGCGEGEKFRTDSYNDGLKFVYAEQLKKLELHHDTAPRNRAIKAFIDELPNDTPVILLWR